MAAPLECECDVQCHTYYYNDGWYSCPANMALVRAALAPWYTLSPCTTTASVVVVPLGCKYDVTMTLSYYC